MLEKCQQEKRFEVIIEVSRWENPRVLSFQLRSRMLEESIDFDVLPAYDPLGKTSCHALHQGCMPLTGSLLSDHCQRPGMLFFCWSCAGESMGSDLRTAFTVSGASVFTSSSFTFRHLVPQPCPFFLPQYSALKWIWIPSPWGHSSYSSLNVM